VTHSKECINVAVTVWGALVLFTESVNVVCDIYCLEVRTRKQLFHMFESDGAFLYIINFLVHAGGKWMKIKENDKCRELQVHVDNRFFSVNQPNPTTNNHQKKVLKALAVIVMPVVRSRLGKEGRKYTYCQHCQLKKVYIGTVIKFKWRQSQNCQIHGLTSRFCVENCARSFWYKLPPSFKKKMNQDQSMTHRNYCFLSCILISIAINYAVVIQKYI